jgi:hypothetical protein
VRRAGSAGAVPHPQKFRRLDGTSVFDRPSEAAFTTTAVLDAEARLLAAMADLTGPAVPAAVLEPLDRPMPGQRLSPDQHAAIVGIATSARRLDVLIGPAGTGKTKTLAVLTRAWAHTHGPDSVLGLAASAAAAAQLSLSLRIPCENTAKWLHDHNHPRTPAPGAAPSVLAEPVAGMLAGLASAQVNGPGSMRAGMLVIVDEASLASTAHLHALIGHVTAAGAKLLLVGDHHQLDAVDAGGGFALLAETAIESGTGHSLDALWRFTNRWEADATRALRTGDPAVIATYADRGRVLDGDTAAMTESAYRAWQADLIAGKTTLLIAPDRDTVTALNLRAREDRLIAGQVAGPEVGLQDGTACAAGDWIITRQNDRRLRIPDGGHVRNGATWTVTAVHPDGTLDAVPREPHDLPGAAPAPERAGRRPHRQRPFVARLRLRVHYPPRHPDRTAQPGPQLRTDRRRGRTAADTSARPPPHVRVVPGLLAGASANDHGDPRTQPDRGDHERLHPRHIGRAARRDAPDGPTPGPGETPGHQGRLGMTLPSALPSNRARQRKGHPWNPRVPRSAGWA